MEIPTSRTMKWPKLRDMVQTYPKGLSRTSQALVTTRQIRAQEMDITTHQEAVVLEVAPVLNRDSLTMVGAMRHKGLYQGSS